MNVNFTYWWSLYTFHILMLLAKLRGLFVPHHALWRVFLNQIQFVPDQHDAQTWLCLSEKWLEPELDVFKCLTLRNVVNNKRSKSFSIMRYCYRSVFLLTCRIPKLSFDCCSIFHCHIFCSKLYTYRVPPSLGQLVFKVPWQKAGFSDKDISDQND